MKRKYPLGLFIIGVFNNLIITWYIPLLAILLFVLHIFIRRMPILIPLAVLIVWIVVAIILQMRIRKTALSMSANEGFNDFMDRVLIDNGSKWHKNVIDTVNNIIDRDNPDT